MNDTPPPELNAVTELILAQARRARRADCRGGRRRRRAHPNARRPGPRAAGWCDDVRSEQAVPEAWRRAIPNCRMLQPPLTSVDVQCRDGVVGSAQQVDLVVMNPPFHIWAAKNASPSRELLAQAGASWPTAESCGASTTPTSPTGLSCGRRSVRARSSRVPVIW